MKTGSRTLMNGANRHGCRAARRGLGHDLVVIRAATDAPSARGSAARQILTPCSDRPRIFSVRAAINRAPFNLVASSHEPGSYQAARDSAESFPVVVRRLRHGHMMEQTNGQEVAKEW